MIATPHPTTPPACRPDLLLTPLGKAGRYVVKNLRTTEYFTLGQQEHFLLGRLDGKQTAEMICDDFEQCFDEPLSRGDLEDFLELARNRGFLQPVELPAPLETSPEADQPAPQPQPLPLPPKPRQSLLYWRKSLFDPDRLFDRLQPKLRWCWTPAFFAVWTACVLTATVLVFANRQELITYFTQALRWETLVLVWLTLLGATACHEFAHGLTCKRYGGQVHEIGFLLMFFMPCFYCNVSDAWLFREKSKRVWVTLAGGLCDLLVWALAVILWRVTYQDSLLNYLSWIVLSVSGIRVLFNFNPLLKLDGYYLLSDSLEIPNLRQRALGYMLGHFRWLLWGAPRPARQSRGRFLLGYGLLCWIFSLTFVTLMLVALGTFLQARVGLAGIGCATLLGLSVSRNLLGGLFRGEVKTMILKRHVRTLLWLAALAGVIAALAWVPMEDRASGKFEVRPVNRGELRAPVPGFLREVRFVEGDAVSQGEPVIRLEVPDLASRIAQKDAELREVEAKLQLLQAGPRPEERIEQSRRVKRAQAWCDLAKQDLARKRQALEYELARFDKLLAQYRAERAYAKKVMDRAEIVFTKRSITDDEREQVRKQYLVFCALCEQTLAEKRARQSVGTLDAETTLAKRQKELAEEQSALKLLEAGTRTEEINAAEAQVARLGEEVKYLRHVQERLLIVSPVSGAVITPRLKEKIGHYFVEGELICEVEDPVTLDVEITLAEEEAARVKPGQNIRLKARALPFDVFEAKVERISPRAVSGTLQNTVTVYCKLTNSDKHLRSGMTGYARIDCGRGPAGEILAKRALRMLRTEFWW